MNIKAKVFVVEFLKTFLGLIFCLIPLLFFYFSFLRINVLAPDVYDLIVSGPVDPIVIYSVFSGTLVGSLITYCWVGISFLFEFLYKKIRKSSGKKSVDQNEV